MSCPVLHRSFHLPSFSSPHPSSPSPFPTYFSPALFCHPHSFVRVIPPEQLLMDAVVHPISGSRELGDSSVSGAIWNMVALRVRWVPLFIGQILGYRRTICSGECFFGRARLGFRRLTDICDLAISPTIYLKMCKLTVASRLDPGRTCSTFPSAANVLLGN